MDLPDLRSYHKVTVIKTAWYRQKSRHDNQWDRTEGAEINPYIIIFNKGGKSILWGARQSLQQAVLGKRDSSCESMKLEHSLTPHTKIYSRGSGVEAQERADMYVVIVFTLLYKRNQHKRV